jgi:hypothetical protein
MNTDNINTNVLKRPDRNTVAQNNENLNNYNRYCYDIECYPNLFTITFVPHNISEHALNTYIYWDKQYLRYKHGYSTNYTIDEIIASKAIIISTSGIKQFVIFKSKNGDEIKNDIPLIQVFFRGFKHLTGYNSNTYDKNLLDILLYNGRFLDDEGYHKKEDKKHITEILYEKSQDIISFGKGYDRLLDFKKYYKAPYRDYDIQKILYLDVTKTALKQVGIPLLWHRIEDLPVHYKSIINEDQINSILDYNLNDVLITHKLRENQINEIKLREIISKEFNIDVLNLSRSSIAVKLMSKYYTEAAGIDFNTIKDLRTENWKIPIREIIHINFYFESKELREFYTKIENMNIIVGTTDFYFQIPFKGKTYNFAKGGLHSEDEPSIIDNNNDEYCLIDCDVTSMYPNAMINWKIAPRHLDKMLFSDVIKNILATRIESKTLSKKISKVLKNYVMNKQELTQEQVELLRANETKYDIKQEALKIVVNAIYGKLGSKDSFLFDLKALYEVTVNLQLCLLKLIEMFELNGIEVISTNTDGVVCKFKKDKRDIYDNVCKQWSNMTKLNLEFTEYEKFIRSNVNNYMICKKGFNEALKSGMNEEELKKNYIKYKGDYVEDNKFNKGYFAPVVKKAINSYFLYGTDYRDYIKNHIDTSPDAIYDYCIGQKVGNNFDIYYRYIKDRKYHDEKLTKTNRVYVSNKGGTIIKKYNDGKVKEISIVKGYNLSLFNDYIRKEDYDIDFSFYYNEVSKIIVEKIEVKQQTLF